MQRESTRQDKLLTRKRMEERKSETEQKLLNYHSAYNVILVDERAIRGRVGVFSLSIFCIDKQVKNDFRGKKI